MTIAEAAKCIGKLGKFKTQDGLAMMVEVTDVKLAWGNVRFVVRSCDVPDTTAITVDAGRVSLFEVAA